MRLITCRPKRGGAPRLGVVLGDEQFLDIGEAAKRARQRLPFDAADMISLIASGKTGLATVRKLVKGFKGEFIALSAVRLMAPIPRPRKNVLCVGWNYVEHFEEGAKARPHVQEMPSHPAFFTKLRLHRHQ